MDVADVENIIKGMSVEELCSQVLIYTLDDKRGEEYLAKKVRTERMGNLYADPMSEKVSEAALGEKIKKDKRLAAIVEEEHKIPCLVTTDAENGAGSYCVSWPELPRAMAWGACDDEKLVERAGELTGRILRRGGISLDLAPVVDLNFNFENAVIGVRAVSDEPKRVIRLAGAYVRGLQKNRYVGAVLKHFPGDGVDNRNQHFLTTENAFSKSKWMNTYGRVYKSLIKAGAMAVMVGHIALPSVQKGETDKYGALPGTLSKILMTDLLKGELGFDGCVISDAMSMIGACARVDCDRLGIEFFKAGGDLMLFPADGEHARLVAAVNGGELSEERLRDAAKRVLKLKYKLRLFEGRAVEEEIGDTSSDLKELENIAREISERAVHVVRNDEGIIPVRIKNPSVLLINLTGHYYNAPITGDEMKGLRDGFAEEGCKVKELFNPAHREVEEAMKESDLVVIATRINFHGATMRVGWNNVMAMWRGRVLKHPRVVFLSLDDAYKLYDFPYAKTYINSFGECECQQRAAAKLILGKIKDRGKNPVSFGKYFKRDD